MASVADIACAAAGLALAAGLLDPDDRSEEDEDEEVGAGSCTGGASSCVWICGGDGGVTSAQGAWRAGRGARAGADGAKTKLPPERRLFLERALRFWNQ
jgi:hypothetical protein